LPQNWQKGRWLLFQSTKILIEHLRQQITDERALHAAELLRVLAENKRLQDSVERLTLRLGLPSTVAEPPEEPKAPVDPDAPPIFSGTPFQRVVQKDEWLRSDAGKRWMAKQLASVKVQESGEAKKEN
jgi:hypothetical protein